MSHEEFMALVYKHYGIIVTVRNKYYVTANADDLTQDILLELWRSIKVLKNNCSFSTWIYNVARNVCISALRKRKNQPAVLGLEEYSYFLADLNDLEDNRELIRQLREAIRYNTVLDTIEEPYRMLFEMYMEGLSYKEMEAQTGISANFLRTKIDRIKKRLQLRYGKNIIK